MLLPECTSWYEAQKIDDQRVLAQLAAEASLDAEGFAAALHDPACSRQVDAEIAWSARYGLRGVPALVLENKYLISGAQPAEMLWRVVDQIVAEREVPPQQPAA